MVEFNFIVVLGKVEVGVIEEPFERKVELVRLGVAKAEVGSMEPLGIIEIVDDGDSK